MNIRQVIGDNVRCCRHKLEWSQQKLGTETGLHHDYIGRLERGLENVSADNIAKIAVVFKTEPANLLIENYCIDGKNL